MKEDRTMLAQEIANGETDTLEFKRDVPSEKLKILKTACAFANGNGGRIVIGVDFRLTVWRTAKSTVRCGDDTVATNSTALYHNSTVGSTVGRSDSTPQSDLTKRLPLALQRLVAALSNETLGSQELCRRLNLKSRGALRQTYILPAIKAGVIDVVGGKTHSSKRAYRVVCPPCHEDCPGMKAKENT